MNVVKPLLSIVTPTMKGVQKRPGGCDSCPFRSLSSGFVPDYWPPLTPRIAVFSDFPTSDDLLEGRPWTGKAGWAWFHNLMEPAGLTRDDVLICNVLRCQPKSYRFPINTMKRSAELNCRQYDGKQWGLRGMTPGGLFRFDPNIFVVSHHPRDAYKTPALRRLILADVKKAVKKADEGYRPLLLLGDEARDLVAPWLKGAAKNWRGHWWVGTYVFKEGTAMVEPGLGLLAA